MVRVLIVDDSRTFCTLLSQRIGHELGFASVIAGSLAQAKEILQRDTDFMAALLDLNLPDAPNGEVVEMALGFGVPAIVLTGQLSDDLRENFWALRIVDYVLKDSHESMDYVLNLLSRLAKNPATKILVVDDSRSFRYGLNRLLAAHRFQVLEAADGREALAVLAQHPDVRLVTVDCNMPEMDGFELTREIRRQFSKEVMAVVGISGQGGARLSARFMKGGANDFLNKPFLTEEFYTRITQNLDMLDRIAQIRDMAERDYLTRAYNRRYFFSTGRQLHALLVRQKQPVALALLDIDHFKNINDTFGHDAGDSVLKQMAEQLGTRFRTSDIVARVGGEEFCVLAAGMTAEAARRVFEDLRQSFEANPACLADRCAPYTVSIGVCCQQGLTLDDMVREADRMMYESKRQGRNRVSIMEA